MVSVLPDCTLYGIDIKTAKALRRAVSLYLRGDQAILIVRLHSLDLVAEGVLSLSNDSSFSLPIWSDPDSDETWLHVPQVAYIFDIPYDHTVHPDWLAHGHVLRQRLSAIWPVIDGNLFYDRVSSENLVDLFNEVCQNDVVDDRDETGEAKYWYDWDEHVFEAVESRPQYMPAAPTSITPGPGKSGSAFGSLPFFDFAGYLRGMLVID